MKLIDSARWATRKAAHDEDFQQRLSRASSTLRLAYRCDTAGMTRSMNEIRHERVATGAGLPGDRPVAIREPGGRVVAFRPRSRWRGRHRTTTAIYVVSLVSLVGLATHKSFSPLVLAAVTLGAVAGASFWRLRATTNRWTAYAGAIITVIAVSAFAAVHGTAVEESTNAGTAAGRQPTVPSQEVHGHASLPPGVHALAPPAPEAPYQTTTDYQDPRDPQGQSEPTVCKVHFAADSHMLTTEAGRIDPQILGCVIPAGVTATSFDHIEIVGHALLGRGGTEEGALELSLRRAVTVRDELEGLGVPGHLLTVRGVGTAGHPSRDVEIIISPCDC
jgi:outer membrane protein OmpA-like peptidoglycan-associated protein